MKKKKIKTVLYVFIPILLIGMVLWEVVLCNIVPLTRRNFKSFDDFLQKTECPFFAESLPDSASGLSYYNHSGWFVKVSGYNCILSEEDYSDWKEQAFKRYCSYNTKAITEFYQYTEGKKLYIDELKEKELNFVFDFCNSENSDYYIFSEIKENSTSHKYHYGIICNDKANEIVEFYYVNSNSNSF